jgi:hypothetical protein
LRQADGDRSILEVCREANISEVAFHQWKNGWLARRGVSTGLPTKAQHRDHVWSWDFISDPATRGGALLMLTILDQYNREYHVLRAAVPSRVAMCSKGSGGPSPSTYRPKSSDGWPANQIKTIYIESDSRWQMAPSRVCMEASATCASTGSSSGR